MLGEPRDFVCFSGPEFRVREIFSCSKFWGKMSLPQALASFSVFVCFPVSEPGARRLRGSGRTLDSLNVWDLCLSKRSLNLISSVWFFYPDQQQFVTCRSQKLWAHSYIVLWSENSERPTRCNLCLPHWSQWAWLLIVKQPNAHLKSSLDILMSFCSFDCKLGGHLGKKCFSVYMTN